MIYGWVSQNHPKEPQRLKQQGSPSLIRPCSSHLWKDSNHFVHLPLELDPLWPCEIFPNYLNSIFGTSLSHNGLNVVGETSALSRGSIIPQTPAEPSTCSRREPWLWVGPDKRGASSHGLAPIGPEPADKQIVSTLMFYLPRPHQRQLSQHGPRNKSKHSLVQIKRSNAVF